jgi:hypothetical protein
MGVRDYVYDESDAAVCSRFPVMRPLAHFARYQRNVLSRKFRCWVFFEYVASGCSAHYICSTGSDLHRDGRLKFFQN